MSTATAPLHRRLGLLLVAAFAFAFVPDAHAQSELMVTPGQGTLNDAIENDTSRPDDRVYVLQRGAYYGVTREINNQGYVLRIKAAEGDGNRPVVHPGFDTNGNPVASRYFNLVDDTYFDDIYFLAVNPQQGENATSFAINTEGMRFVVDNCVFQGGRSRLIEINVDDTKLYFTDSQFRNLIRADGSSNGRPIDYRTVTGDTLFVQNTSFLNISGYLVRYDGPTLENVVFDHNTIYVTGRELTTFSFATQAINYRFTNNLVVNPYGFGQEPDDDGMFEDGVVRVDSLDEDIDNGFTEADRTIVFENNGYMITDDLQAYYDGRTASGDPLGPYVLIHHGTIDYAENNPNTVVLNENETYDIAFTDPPNLDDYIAYLGNFRDGAPEPGMWTFGSEDLFPADQPPPENLAYPSSNPAYSASILGFPLGDLNYFPDEKAMWEEALETSSEDGAPGSSFAISEAFPNPTTGRLAVRFDLDAASTVAIDVYDVLGRRVLSLPERAVPAGTRHQASIDASALTSGMYFLRMTVESGAETLTQTGRFTVAK